MRMRASFSARIVPANGSSSVGLRLPLLLAFDQAQFRGDLAAQHDVIDAPLDAQRLEVDRATRACQSA